MDVAQREVELRKLALQKLGLSTERRDYNLTRIVDLASQALGYETAIFSVLEGENPVEICRSVNADFRVQPGPHCAEVARTGERHCAGGEHEEAGAYNYLALPVFSPEKRPIGTLSLFSKAPPRQTREVEFQLANGYVRLIEDSLLLRTMSVRDALTGMFNRRYFEDQCAVEWRRAMRMQVPLSFAVIDVDHFKSYNDSVGHSGGDEVLIRVAETIRSGCRRAGDISCRYGGEEFAVLLPSTSAASAMETLDHMRRELVDQAIPHPGTGGVVTISAGVSTASSVAEIDNMRVDDFLDAADHALYEAKAAGRNQVRHISNVDFGKVDNEALLRPYRTLS